MHIGAQIRADRKANGRSRNLLARLDPSHEWGSEAEIGLYLDRCQVDTPIEVIEKVWEEISARRANLPKVVDFGAGDGRFARHGKFGTYVGVEIDGWRCMNAKLPDNARLIHSCVFNVAIADADACVGNPPYVRNQDLPIGWRQSASSKLLERSGITLSGLANAWQYFFLLSLISAKDDGIVALVIPYEWVSRPSAKAIRDYISAKGWSVTVYRLLDGSFDRVLTTSSITIVDKAKTDGDWSYFQRQADGSFMPCANVTTNSGKLVNYYKRGREGSLTIKAKRGLSPGTQKVLTLSDGERARLGLRVDVDVVPCVTTLRHLPACEARLDKATFERFYVKSGKKCWLLETTGPPSTRLQAYLDSVPSSERDTATCKSRDDWWRFTMPEIPDVLVATGFRGSNTKAVVNAHAVRAVGSVAGIYGLKRAERTGFAKRLVAKRVGDRVVAHSHGLRKLEINQLNYLIQKDRKRRQTHP
jgi:hypothetical protein